MPGRSLPAAVRRAASAAARVRIDGRLPEPIGRLVRDDLRLRVRGARWRLTARWLPPVGTRRVPAGLTVAAHAGRRWAHSGDIATSLHDLTHEHASAMIEALGDAGCRPFLVEAGDGGVVVGVDVAERGAALGALAELGGGWYLTWRRGDRRHTRLLDGRRLPRSARAAESWRLHRMYRVADGVLAGRDEAVEVTFWEQRDGRYEQLGMRGLHRFEADAARTIEHVAGRSYPGVAAFPVERALTRADFAVDVVYTWVDGSDPAWQGDLARWQAAEGERLTGDDGAHPSRYRDNDELRYSLRSLWLHAGWVRRIFVVTSGQVPGWLVEDDRLQVVPHAALLPADALPTFNSHAIEARLHHVEDLAEHFVYMNDDMFLGGPVGREAFFTSNGLPRFFPSEARVPLDGRLAMDTAARNGRRLVEAEYGRVVERKLHHGPYALRRSTLVDIEQRHRCEVEATVRHRFRHPDDLSIPASLAHHVGFATRRAVVGSLALGYEHLESRRLGLFLDRVRRGRDLDAFCVNETEARGVDPQRNAERLRRFLDAYFPLASPWERRGRA